MEAAYYTYFVSVFYQLSVSHIQITCSYVFKQLFNFLVVLLAVFCVVISVQMFHAI